MHSIDLGSGVTSEVHDGFARTVYPDGFHMDATRPDTSENRAEAADQSYPATAEGVWQSLLEHEAGHTLAGRILFGTESAVLRHESGADPHRYAKRLHEEAFVLSAQRLANTGQADPVLAMNAWAARNMMETVRSLLRPALG
jgi:hypothetical protein